jgi:hypothetical protein
LPVFEGLRELYDVWFFCNVAADCPDEHDLMLYNSGTFTYGNLEKIRNEYGELHLEPLPVVRGDMN